MFAVDCVSKHELSWTVKLIFTCGWILLFCPDFTLHIWLNTKREESQDTEFEQAVSHKGPVVVWQTLAKMLACTYFLSASTWAGSFRNASMCNFLSATMWAWSFKNVGMCIFSLCNIASAFQNVSMCIFSATAWAGSFTNLGGNNFHWVPHFHTSSRIISMSQGCQKGNIGVLLENVLTLHY